MSDRAISTSDQFGALKSVVAYRPLFTVGLIFFSTFVAVLEGVGISFIVPIIQTTRDQGAVSEDGLAGLFVRAFDFLGIPFVLEYVLLSVGVVIVFRFTGSFVVAWTREKLKASYVADLRRRTFEAVIKADVSYFDRYSTDETLNTIITQTEYAGDVVHQLVRFVEEGFIGLMYFLIALYLSPPLALGTAVVLGIIMVIIRYVIESGYDTGDRLATANERIQTSVQTSIQGIRDVKLFNIDDELYEDFRDALDRYVASTVKISRNSAAFTQAHNLSTTLVVFSLIYVALRFTSLSLSELGVFLFAMFRLSPRVSAINNKIYAINSGLPHIVRTNDFIERARSYEERDSGSKPAPDKVREIETDSVTFAYEEDEPVLEDISFSIERGEFVAFVGPSGAGKSTIVSLLSRFYQPDSGTILANGTPISEYKLDDWRSELAVVRQHPIIFNESLRYNLTIGNRDASKEQLDQACELAQVAEFFDDLPDGYETILGEDGVRLSGGQRQRVALARALITDAEILVLDEATSDLDTNIETDVQKAIEQLETEYTVITIAHRLSTVKNADRIYTLEHGEIVESGTHSELIENEGTYADLYTAQSKQV